jgi:hypothetical protein
VAAHPKIKGKKASIKASVDLFRAQEVKNTYASIHSKQNSTIHFEPSSI